MTTPNAALQADFSVSYEGPAYADNSIEVRELAPALLALGQALDRANLLLNGDRATVSLSIRATRPSSFEVALFLRQLLEGASDVLSGDLFTSAANLTEVVIGGPAVTLGLFGVIKKLRGKKPKITPTADAVVFEAENVKLVVPTEVARLYADTVLKEQLEAFVRPLQRPGADRVVFKRGQIELERVERDEVPYFTGQESEANVKEYIIPRQRLQITSLTFKEGKWKLSDGANVHWYAMRDENFSKSIRQGKRFGTDDILVCEVLLTQGLRDDGKLKMDYTVQKVLEHIMPGSQLPFEDAR